MHISPSNRKPLLLASVALFLFLSSCGQVASAGRDMAPATPTLAASTPVVPITQPPTTTTTPEVAPITLTAEQIAAIRASLPGGPLPTSGAPAVDGQVILVSLTQQWLWAYENGALVYRAPVATGRPELATPTGTYHVLLKRQNIVFHSPWPQGSPFYYEPENVNYALYFRDTGYYIHDAPWREAFGPGADLPHTNADGTDETGSHGCVNVPTFAGEWLYNWASVGATIIIQD